MKTALSITVLAITMAVAGAAAGTWPPEPTAHYASLEAARDSIGLIISHSVDLGDTAIHVSREQVNFDYLYAKGKAKGWAFHVVVNDTTECPNEAIEQALVDAGWVESFGYSADGADGSDMGYLSRNYFCLVEGSWQGGDESDDTYVPPPGCKVTVTCVPRREDDIPSP